MKVTLDKNIELNSAYVYLRFEKEIDRKDIQEYLKGKSFENSLIENRVKDYLKNIKVFDEKLQITPLGQSVKETGLLPTVEEGKYQIWFTNGDSHFGNKIFYFKRIQPSRDGSDEKLQLRFDEDGHFYLPTESNSFSNLKLLPIRDYFGQNINRKDFISLRWTWEDLEESNYVFDGQLGKGENSIKLKPTSVPCQENIKDLIEKLLPDWDNKSLRFKISFSELSEQNRISFEANQETQWKDFKVQFQKIPLMPYNKEEALKWRNWLLIENLRKEYLSPSDFENAVVALNKLEGLKTFSESLDVPDPQTFSREVKKDALAFWHLNAPMDLNPKDKI